MSRAHADARPDPSTVAHRTFAEAETEIQTSSRDLDGGPDPRPDTRIAGVDREPGRDPDSSPEPDTAARDAEWPDLAHVRPPGVALLVDYPILMRAIRATDPDGVPDLARLVQRASTLGPLLTARAFGAWYDTDEARTAFVAGLDPVFVPPAGPSGAPTATALIAEGLAVLRAGGLEVLAVSGDDRLLPLLAAGHAAGVRIALLAHSTAPGGPCRRLADVTEPVSAFVRSLSRAEKYRRVAPPGRSA